MSFSIWVVCPKCGYLGRVSWSNKKKRAIVILHPSDITGKNYTKQCRFGYTSEYHDELEKLLVAREEFFKKQKKEFEAFMKMLNME